MRSGRNRGDDLNPYVKKGLISRLPVWFKALFIKFWFAGAVFYFVGWGLFINTTDQLDLTVALGLVLGLFTDIIVNRILVFLESGKKEYRKYMLCYSKRFFSVPVNLFMGVIVSFLVSYTYHFVNVLAIIVNDLPDGYVTFGAEPIVFGLLYLGWEMLFVSTKNLFMKIYYKAKEQ